MTANTTLMESEWGEVSVYLLAILLGIIIVAASIGNLAVMVAIVGARHKCDRGYVYIFNLAFVDFLTSVCVMPISLVTLLNGDFIFSHAVCVFNGYTTQVFFITSIHTLMYMSVYRFMSISHPFIPIHLGKIAGMIIASWAWALMVSGLSSGLLSRFLHKPYTTQCGPGYPEDALGWINVAIVAGACFIIPLIVIVCVYILLFRKANKLFTRLEDPSYSNYSHEAHTEQRRLSITFIIIVVGFLICWTPIFTYLNYASLVEDKSSIYTLINPIVYWFSYLNSAINPLIYGFRTPIFSRLREQLSACQRKPEKDEFPKNSIHSSPKPTNKEYKYARESKPSSRNIEDIEICVAPCTTPSHDLLDSEHGVLSVSQSLIDEQVHPHSNTPN